MFLEKISIYIPGKKKNMFPEKKKNMFLEKSMKIIFLVNEHHMKNILLENKDFTLISFINNFTIKKLEIRNDLRKSQPLYHFKNKLRTNLKAHRGSNRINITTTRASVEILPILL